MSDQHPMLFQPFRLRGLTLRNRVVVSPMAQYSAEDGAATDWHFAHFARFAVGGAGLVFSEAVKVERRGLGTVGDMGLWDDAQIAPLRRITDFLRRHGAASGIQLNHAGRKAGTARPWEGFGPLDRAVPIEGRAHWQVVGPSAISHAPGYPVPHALSTNEVVEQVNAWAQAARRAVAAGFDVLEIHGAHGYLVHQFLSPEANRREDRYGGSLANRMRFALEITEAVRAIWPADRPVFFRISAVDDRGWTMADSIVLARELKACGVDVIDCSSGGIAPGSPTASRTGLQLGYQVPYAAELRRESALASMAVGLIVGAAQAEAILQGGSADLVAIGREMLRDPFWAAHAAEELGADPGFALLPPQYGWWLERRRRSGYPVSPPS